MKTRFILDCVKELDFSVLAINSHTKAYKLCWNLNKYLQLNFEKKEDHSIKEGLWFSRYTSVFDDDVAYTLLANRSKNGYLIPSEKSVNFFLLIKNDYWQQEKTKLISKLRDIEDILLVFEVDTSVIKHIDRFIFYDKKD
tara:strand:+ start:212 stop:631 length:420 start_codon:yes stop_codon:yes gene_type:complete